MTIDPHLTEVTRNRYQRNAGWYDLMGLLAERKFLPWRKQLWALATGPRILEVGVGTGRNLPFYPKNIDITGIDLTPGMLERAIRRVSELGLTADLRLMDVQQLDFQDASFDSVVATCVFCSVPNPILGFQEIKRVLKPGGRLYLLEHMRSVNPMAGRIMDLLNPMMVQMMGANINRKTLDNIQSAGLEIEESKDLDKSGIFKFIVVGR